MRRMRHLKPREIQGCQLALDASIATSLYDATSGGSLVAANGQVARWEDQSGNARHMTQPTSLNRPLRRVAAVNGVDAVDFDGNDSISAASTAVLRNVTAWSALVVATTDVTSYGSTAIMLFVERSALDGGSRANLYLDTTAKPSVGGRRLDADTFSTAGALGAVTAATAYCFSAVGDHSVTTVKLMQNSAQVASNTSWLTSGSTSDVNAGSIRLAHNTSAGGVFDGKITLAGIWHGALNDSVRRRMEHGMMRKWRING